MSGEKKRIALITQAKDIDAIFKKGAESRSKKYELSEDFIKGLVVGQKVCYLSGLSLYWNSKSDNNVSIDRIDSDVGYTADNVLLCHKSINLMKHRYPVEVFIDLCQHVANYQNHLNSYKHETYVYKNKKLCQKNQELEYLTQSLSNTSE